MLVETAGAARFLFAVLENAPELFERLIEGLSEEEADFRPDSDRFSIREVMAHLADWDTIFLSRIEQTRDEDEPQLAEFETTQRAIQLDYEHSSPQQQCQLFKEHRKHLVEVLRSLSPQDWPRYCQHPRVGRVSLEGLVTLIVLHDAYHVRQVVEWRHDFKNSAS